jgi:hypothetical protein
VIGTPGGCAAAPPAFETDGHVRRLDSALGFLEPAPRYPVVPARSYLDFFVTNGVVLPAE